VPEVSSKRRIIQAIVAATAIVALVVAAILVVEQALPAAPAPPGEEPTVSGSLDDYQLFATANQDRGALSSALPRLDERAAAVADERAVLRDVVVQGAEAVRVLLHREVGHRPQDLA
jgi:hypothetical protein